MLGDEGRNERLRDVFLDFLPELCLLWMNMYKYMDITPKTFFQVLHMRILEKCFTAHYDYHQGQRKQHKQIFIWKSQPWPTINSTFQPNTCNALFRFFRSQKKNDQRLNQNLTLLSKNVICQYGLKMSD